MTQYRSSSRASHHPLDMDARFRERLRRDHAHTPPETVPPAGTVLDVVPLPDTGNVLMIVAHVVPASAAPLRAQGVTSAEPSPEGGEAQRDQGRTGDVRQTGAGSPGGGAPSETPPIATWFDAARFDTTRFDASRSAPAWPGGRPPNTSPPHASPDRTPAATPPGGLRIDRPSRCAWVDGREVDLTFQEFELLAHLTAHPWTVFSRAELMKALWPNVDDATRTVDVHVHRLRRKLGRAGAQLTTVRRVGYVYRPHLADRAGLPQSSE